MRDCGSHLGGPVPPALCRSVFSTYIGKKSLWKYLTGMSSNLTPCKIEFGVRLLWSTFRILWISSTDLMENGQNISSIICGHIRVPCRRSVCAPFFRISPTPPQQYHFDGGCQTQRMECLILCVYRANESIVWKSTIVGVITINSPSGSCHGFHHCLFGKQRLCKRLISQETHVDIVTNVIYKICAPPEALVG